MRWHRLEPGGRSRTLCGLRFTRFDFMETTEEVAEHDRCLHCNRAKRPHAG